MDNPRRSLAGCLARGLGWRSFLHNNEANVLVLDGSFADQLERLFALNQSAWQEITRSEWWRRGLDQRFREWLVRRMEYLL